MAGRPRSRRARLLVLGAGPAQLGLLEAVRSRPDVDAIAVDRDPGAIGLPLAAERALLSSEDEPAVERLARAREVHGIVSPGADWPVGVAARVAERIGLAHPIDARTAAVATSKERQRECFLVAGVPHARALDPDDPDLPLPCVVKAPDRQGQRGLALVRERPELAPALDEARSESRSGTVLVEELVEGPEATVVAMSVDGVFLPLAVTDRVTAEPPAFGVALAHVWPSLLDAAALAEAARGAVEAIGIRSGPSYTQLRVGPGGEPIVMEVAARLGGGHDAELCEEATGVDANGLAIDAALGRVPDVLPVGQPAGGAVVRFLVPPEGTLVSVDGTEAAAAVEGVRWVRSYRRTGHVFGPFRRGADRAGAILAVGRTRAEALARADEAARLVRFRLEQEERSIGGGKERRG